jgi:hypothetical protein
MDILQKIFSFTDIFKIFTKEEDIKKYRKFKEFKIELVKIIITFLKKK